MSSRRWLKLRPKPVQIPSHENTSPDDIRFPVIREGLPKETVVCRRSAFGITKGHRVERAQKRVHSRATQRRGKFPKDVDTKHYTLRPRLAFPSLQASPPAKKRPSTRLRGCARDDSSRGGQGVDGSGSFAARRSRTSYSLSLSLLLFLSYTCLHRERVQRGCMQSATCRSRRNP